MHDDVRMWHYMALQEGTLGVDPDFQKTNDGRMPPAPMSGMSPPVTAKNWASTRVESANSGIGMRCS